MGNSISAYVQVYKQQRAVFEALKSFRTHYRDEPVTVLSDDGDDFSRMSAAFDARYIHSGERVVTGPELRTTNLWPLEGTYAWFDRLYEHCVSFDTDWVLFLTSGTRTIRRVRSFPDAPIVGARSNPFSPALTNLSSTTKARASPLRSAVLSACAFEVAEPFTFTLSLPPKM